MTALDDREFLLGRLATVIALIAPGVTFRTIDGGTTEPCTVDLGGRVWQRMRSEQRTDVTEMPCVELVTSAENGDSLEVISDTLYAATTQVQLWGYQKADDQGDGFDSAVRPLLNALRADIVKAVDAFPFYDPGDGFGTAGQRCPPCTVSLRSQWTEPASDAPDGYLVMVYDIRWLMNTKNG